MELKTLPTEYKLAALEKWREYVAAEKLSRKPEYRDLKKIYAQVKLGKKVCDIHQAIAKAGVHSNHHPKLAIAQAKAKIVHCRYLDNGTVRYADRRDGLWSPLKRDIELKNCLPVYDRVQVTGNRDNNLADLTAPVPMVPPRFVPKDGFRDDYYILWDVDKWEMSPPVDPWLLKRITRTVFQVLASWDLTELERSVMRSNF
jgi:hypothetical protein